MRGTIYWLVIPLTLAAFTHLWNPAGFPSIHHDEDTHYIPRALILMNGGGPQQDPELYDHPFFGQIFLAALFVVIGYPYPLLNIETANTQTVELLYTVPRILMGLLAVLDTFLVYKISEVYYDKRVAIIASVLFAVTTTSLSFKQVLLDNIALPFLLSSIFLAVRGNATGIHKSKKLILVLLSGIFLGLTIFTKIPSFTMIPVVGFLVSYKNLNSKMIAMWLAPVLLIPIIWPTYAIYTDSFDAWIRGVVWQSTGRPYQPLPDSIYRLFQIDPILLILGVGGFSYVAFKREYFLLLWVIPYLIFSYVVGFFSFFHFALVLPAFCISASRLIRDLDKIITNKKNKQIIAMSTFIGVAIFGLIGTINLMSISASKSYFESVSFTNQYIPQKSEQNPPNDKVTVIGPPGYFWIPKYIYGKTEHNYKSWWQASFLQNSTTKILFIVPHGLMTERMSGTNEQAKLLQTIYRDTHLLAIFDRNQNSTFNTSVYPFTSIKESPLSGKIEIRSNY